MPTSPDKDTTAERVSMHGVDPVEALRALLAVDPESEPVDDDEDGSAES